jgi:hypothetical protein
MVNPDNYKTVENKIMLLFKLFNSLAGIKQSVKHDNKNIIFPLILLLCYPKKLLYRCHGDSVSASFS